MKVKPKPAKRVAVVEKSPPLVDQPTLTVREAEVAIGIADGKTYREIGESIGLGYETVRAYVDRLREHTGRLRKAQLAIWAYQQLDWLRDLIKAAGRKKGAAA